MTETVRLTWKRNPAGYSIVEESELGEYPIPWERSGKERYIIGRSGELQDYTHLMDHDGLIFPQYLNAKTDDAIIRFSARFGIMEHQWHDLYSKSKGETMEADDDMQIVSVHGDLHIYPVRLFTGQQNFLLKMINEIKKSAETPMGHEIKAAHMLPIHGIVANVELVPHSSRPALVFTAETLFTYMTFEAAMVATGSRDIRQCPACGNIFITGTGTDRRSNGVYCRNTCRQRAYDRGRREAKTKKSSKRPARKRRAAATAK